jgi:hypothetical protein
MKGNERKKEKKKEKAVDTKQKVLSAYQQEKGSKIDLTVVSKSS